MNGQTEGKKKKKKKKLDDFILRIRTRVTPIRLPSSTLWIILIWGNIKFSSPSQSFPWVIKRESIIKRQLPNQRWTLHPSPGAIHTNPMNRERSSKRSLAQASGTTLKTTEHAKLRVYREMSITMYLVYKWSLKQQQLKGHQMTVLRAARALVYILQSKCHKITF